MEASLSLMNRFLDRLLDWLMKPAKRRPLPPVKSLEGPSGSRPSY